MAQTYTSFFDGNTVDTTTQPTGGSCLMGGATEHDGAMQWFLQGANGGDVLVLRASGSDGYNDYFLNQLGVPINSVESIVCLNAASGNDAYIVSRIEQAEAIWFAGGDQWNYVNYWRNTPVMQALNDAINTRNCVVGGTSAGMAILGGAYLSAETGTITSAQALANPYHANLTVDNTSFLQVPYLDQIITDTHYDDPDRKGRHVTFLARAYANWNQPYKGIACNEYTSLCIAANGIATAYGEYPAYDEFVYLIQPNCEVGQPQPENITSGAPLHWQANGEALKVLVLPGTDNGLYTFDLNDWKTSTGGTWQKWSVNQGSLVQSISTAPTCTNQITKQDAALTIELYPNPVVEGTIYIASDQKVLRVEIFTTTGQTVAVYTNVPASIQCKEEWSGVYFVKLTTEQGTSIQKIIVN